MQKTFLENNPFYILEIMPGDKRTSIISKAEEKAFFTDGNECEEAQASLINPSRRLSAELEWFFNITANKQTEIITSIKNKKEICTDELSGISRLNAVLHNFSVHDFDDYLELGYAILEVDELYSSIDLAQLLSNINDCRQQAGMRDVSEDELEREFTQKRDHIRHLISEKIISLSDEDYVDFITILAEKCIADEDYNDGIVISDIIDQYEIKMQGLIEETADEIYSHIERIKGLTDDEAIEDNITGLIRRVEKWDHLVQPLQLKSMASGVAHSGSEKMGRALHVFSVWLHNEKGLSNLSLRLIDAVKPIFAEIGDLFDTFETDSDTLSNIIRGNEEAEQAVAQMDDLKASAHSMKVYATSSKVDEFIDKVKAVNRKVKQISLKDELVKQIRENICYIARDVAISLHNDKQQTEYAIKIANMLLAEFGDLSELKQKLSQDVATLNQQILLKEQIRYQQEAQKRAKKTKLIGYLIGIGVILLICLFTAGLSECRSSDNSEPYVFSQSAESGDDVFIDIVSIEPVYSISEQGSYIATDVACRCTTSEGKTAWVYMSIYEYNEYIDSSARLGNSFSADFETVRYSSAKRIYGNARRAENLCDGLAAKTETMILKFESIE